MKVSIVTVTFNSAATVADTLRSVATQTHPDIEHIIVDGASTDATLRIVADSGGHVARTISERDRGIYDAMNKGIAAATGELVGFLNSDDVLAHDRVIATIVATMSDPALDACFGDLVYVRQDDLDIVVRYWKSRPYAPGLCRRGWMPAHPTFYARKAVYRSFGDFDLSFRLQSDFEMSLRLFEMHGIRTAYIPETLVRMREGGVSNRNVRNVLKGNLEAARACRKHGFSGGVLFVAGKLLSRVPQFFARPDAP